MTAASLAASPAPRRSTYSQVAIALHWLIALLIIGNIGLAWWFNTLSRVAQIGPVQLHKSIGITVLILSVIRVGWRLVNQPPPLPATLKPWELWGARATHLVFYILMLGLPLSGWAFSSASPLIKVHPITLYGVIPWPAFPLPGLDSDGLHAAHKTLEFTHFTLAKLAYATIALHVAAALKHQFFDHDDVLSRMLPFLQSKSGAA